MNKQDAWNKFSLTGSVADYLSFKAIEKKQSEKVEENENKNHRTDSKTTEYW
ncbi:MAG: YqzL family protein [Ruminococcaceae bacterium]|nr:YqzL family protein [Oscillospiraceae bacterium]